MGKYEISRACARGEASALPSVNNFGPRLNLKQSEWLDNNENHDSDHQQGRDFVDNTVKLA
jgi:hypothetical protein